MRTQLCTHTNQLHKIHICYRAENNVGKRNAGSMFQDGLKMAPRCLHNTAHTFMSPYSVITQVNNVSALACFPGSQKNSIVLLFQRQLKELTYYHSSSCCCWCTKGIAQKKNRNRSESNECIVEWYIFVKSRNKVSFEINKGKTCGSLAEKAEPEMVITRCHYVRFLM